jgi:hypothetical protein
LCERLLEEMVCVCILKLYEESDASSENNHEDDFSGSDDDILGLYDDYIMVANFDM